jgi:hypothetical protein
MQVKECSHLPQAMRKHFPLLEVFYCPKCERENAILKPSVGPGVVGLEQGDQMEDGWSVNELGGSEGDCEPSGSGGVDLANLGPRPEPAGLSGFAKIVLKNKREQVTKSCKCRHTGDCSGDYEHCDNCWKSCAPF